MGGRLNPTNVPTLRQRTEADRRSIYTAIMQGRDFVAGGMRGTSYPPDDPPCISAALENALFPRAWKDRFLEDCPTFVVWSFRTPVAWYVPERDAGLSDERTEPPQWTVPNLRYSNAQTARHARYARTATVLANPITTLDERR